MARRPERGTNHSLIGEPSMGSRYFARLEDMSQRGKLTLVVQSDGDVIVGIQQHHGEMADVEFCAPGAGGGGSHRTWQALRALAAAMELDNADPLLTARRSPGECFENDAGDVGG